MRPIMLTAAAATLALIPIAHEIFWGPMAYAMMGGIVVRNGARRCCSCRRSMSPGSGYRVKPRKTEMDVRMSSIRFRSIFSLHGPRRDRNGRR